MTYQSLIGRLRSARGDPSLAVLEGFHPLKHAIRFGAELIEVVSLDVVKLEHLAESIAPDILRDLHNFTFEVPSTVFEQLAPVPPPTGVIAVARRPTVSITQIIEDPAPAPVVLLENPRNPFNIGAAIRVSAAAGAAGVITTGAQDPWHSAALTGAAGLQYALPVSRTATIPVCDRSLVAVDPSGEPIQNGPIPANAILAFGSERRGLSREIMDSADKCVSIPMSTGVSSLNLATAVAVVLYGWRLGQSPGRNSNN